MSKQKIALSDEEWRVLIIALETEIRRAKTHAAELRSEADRLVTWIDMERPVADLNDRASREEVHAGACSEVLSTILHSLGWPI